MSILDQFSLKGKVAMVTGAGQGLGRQFALALADAGARVVVAEINPDNGEKVAEEVRALGVDAAAITTDVTDPESVRAAVRSAVETFGRIDVLVNNAGISIWGDAENMPLDHWFRVLDVNMHGVLHCCQAVGSVMLEQGKGSIINIASISGSIVNVPQHQVNYNTSKAAVIHMTRSMAVEWAQRGVRVNCISPGYMYTDLVAELFKDARYGGGTWMERTPMGRPGQPEELGPLVVYLASDASSYMTGSNIVIDGGYSAV